MRRKVPLVTGEVYHVFSKSIAGFRIFNSDPDYRRMLCGVLFFKIPNPQTTLSWLLRNGPKRIEENATTLSAGQRVQLIAYCIMQTHFHLLLRQTEDHGISTYMGELQNSYARYFNIKYKRKGHLWESAFCNVHVSSDEQALHVTRYIHLNPVTAYLAGTPGEWQYSSYLEYMSEAGHYAGFCDLTRFPTLSPEQYSKFVADLIAHQRMLADHKRLVLDDPLAP